MKRITVLFLILLLLTGCTPKLSKHIKNKRSEFVTSLGVTKNDKIVITNKKKTQYYVYYLLNDYSYVSYLYIMHDNEKNMMNTSKIESLLVIMIYKNMMICILLELII